MKPSWVRHRLLDGTEFYLNLQTLEGSWQCPRSCSFNTTHLSREEIQVWAGWGWLGTGGAAGAELSPRVLAVGRHPSDSGTRPPAPVGVQRRLGGEAAGEALGLPGSPAAPSKVARPARAGGSCHQDPGDTATVCPSSERSHTNQGRPLAGQSVCCSVFLLLAPPGQCRGCFSRSSCFGYCFPVSPCCVIVFLHVPPEKAVESQ